MNITAEWLREKVLEDLQDDRLHEVKVSSDLLEACGLGKSVLITTKDGEVVAVPSNIKALTAWVFSLGKIEYAYFEKETGHLHIKRL